MDKRVLSIVRGFLALAMDDDMEKTGVEIEKHLEQGGSIEPIMEEINRAVNDSGFFALSARAGRRGIIRARKRREKKRNKESLQHKRTDR